MCGGKQKRVRRCREDDEGEWVMEDDGSSLREG